MLTDKTVIVDVSGSGQSLRRLRNHLALKPSLWLLVGYVESRLGRVSQVPHAIEWLGTTTVELANLAKHPMVCDVMQQSDETYVPVFLNPTGVNWAHIPEINVMHDAFNLAISVMSNYDFSADLRIDDLLIVSMLKRCFQRIEEAESVLTAFANVFFGAEEVDIRQTLWRKATSRLRSDS
jgi:hypothetical protein